METRDALDWRVPRVVSGSPRAPDGDDDLAVEDEPRYRDVLQERDQLREVARQGLAGLGLVEAVTGADGAGALLALTEAITT